MAFQVKKVQTFPPAFQETDEVLAVGESSAELPYRLAELGFADAKTKLVEGTTVYYKGKTNMLYVQYVQELTR